VWVFKAPRVQLATEFDRISELPTSCQQQPNLPSTLGLATPPSQPRAPHQFHSRGSGQARCVTRNDGEACSGLTLRAPRNDDRSRMAAARAGVIASEAKQSMEVAGKMDCFVASLLAIPYRHKANHQKRKLPRSLPRAGFPDLPKTKHCLSACPGQPRKILFALVELRLRDQGGRKPHSQDGAYRLPLEVAALHGTSKPSLAISSFLEGQICSPVQSRRRGNTARILANPAGPGEIHSTWPVRRS